MNVLFLTKYDVARFGIAHTVQALSATLEPLGMDVLVCSSHESARSGVLPNGWPCVRAPLSRPGLLSGKAEVKRLAALCGEHAIDLVHCHGIYRPGYTARQLKALTGLPYVLTSWGDIVPSSSRQQRRSVRRRCRAILADADAVTSPTTAIAGYVRDICNVDDKHTLIPNGIYLDQWRAEPIPPQGDYVFALGTLTPQKGFHVLIDAMKRAAAPLVVGGEGEQAEALREQAAGAAVEFPGYLDGQAKCDAFHRAKLVAFPSQYGEGFPGVLLEAMAAGRAIVASDLPVTRSILTEGVSAVLVPPADVDAWAEAIAGLLADDSRRQAMERTNATAAEEHDWPVVAGRFAEVYARVLV